MQEAQESILNPSLFINSIEWREPVTTLTDFLVAIAAMYALFRFVSYKGEKGSFYYRYQIYFLCFAIGMTCAAWLGHGLQAYISPRWKTIGWFMSATGQLFLITASIDQLKISWGKRFRNTAKGLAILKYVVFALIIFNPDTSSFRWVQYNSSIDLIALILPLQLFFYSKTKMKGSLILVLAIVYAVIPGLIFSSELSIGRWFNFHDISHTMMALFMLFMFYGSYTLVTHPKYKEILENK